MRKLVTLVLIITLAGIASACNKVEDGQEDKLTASDKQYYEKLDNFVKTDNATIDKYISIYVKYNGRDIPNSEYEFLVNNTDDTFINKLQNTFLNKADYSETQEDTSDAEETQVQGEDEVGDSEDMTAEEEEPITNDTTVEDEQPSDEIQYPEVAQTIYSYKDNIYMVKIGLPNGQLRVLYFKVLNDKVVDIYEF